MSDQLDIFEMAEAHETIEQFVRTRQDAPQDVQAIETTEDSEQLDEIEALELSDELGSGDAELDELADGQTLLFNVDDHLVEQSHELAESCYSVDEILDEAFKHYRIAGFPLRKLDRHLQLQVINKLAQTSSDALLQSALGYSVADTYHPHRLSVQIGHRPSPIMAFQDDVKLKHALRLCIEQNGIVDDGRLLSVIQLVRGAQAAANFRPGFALLMYRRFAEPDGVVLDTSMGFGGRLVGFLASRCKHYIGIDPARLQYDANVALAQSLCDIRRQSCSFINLPAEDVAALTAREIEYEGSKLNGTCDFAFTSPPYFSKEHYSDEDTQSWKRFPEGESWRMGFLEPMMQLNFDALKVGAYCCINVADVVIDGKPYELAKWTERAGIKAGFHFAGTERFPISRGYGQGVKKEKFEPVLKFRKETTT